MSQFFLVKKNGTLFLFLFILLNLFSNTLLGQLNKWKTFTAMREVIQFIEADGTLWGATTGGLLLYNFESDAYQAFTNTSGLSSNDVSSVAVDKSNRVWVAQTNGLIHIFDVSSREIVEIIAVFEGNQIYDMTSAGDTMFVSLNVGISEYRIDRQESKEIYRQLGEDIPEEIPVTQTFLFENFIYAATNNGLGKADRNLPNLKAPQSWQSYTTADGLPSNKIQDLAVFDDKILIATNAGIAQENSSGLIDFSGPLPAKNIISLSVKKTAESEVLYAASATDIYFTSDLQTWTRIPPVIDSDNIIKKIKHIENDLWVGFVAKDLRTSPFALAQFNEGEETWITYSPDGPKTKTFNSIAYDIDSGYLWVAAQGIMAYHEEKGWFNFEDSDVFGKGDFRKVIVDQQNRVWFGHWGDGIFVVSGNPDNYSAQVFNHENERLSPISTAASSDFVVVDEIMQDASGNIWISNFIPASGRPLAVVNSTLDSWSYFSLAEGIRSPHIHSIVDDLRRPGWIWYGSGGVHAGHPGNGVGVVVHNNTLTDKTDDNYSQGFNTDEGLLSLDVRTVAQDQDGTMWFGTPEGLNFWLSGNVNQFIGILGGDKLISTDIKVIKIDAANNKWIGTSSGITVIGPENNRLTHYTTDNSPIVSNDIKDFAFNSVNGDVYIATTQGLSILSTPFSTPKSDFSQISGFPNPFLLDGSGNTFKFGNLMAFSGIKIFTSNGEVVRDFEPGDFSGTIPEWDGRDEDDQLVGSGIYFFVGYTENGESGVGKIAVIRK
ncbi:MAG: hypothetical protein DWQ05_10000 [Calditrichaeota bacterium]|nr:MAG: hypothetical protein DWQ05_10000 [Calditrichota bacterium]